LSPGSSEALGVGNRLSAPPSKVLALSAFQHELDAADLLWAGLSLADIAHAIALDEAGLLPDGIRFELFAGLLELHDLDLDTVDLDPTVGDIYNNRDRLLRGIAPGGAGFVHTGRARREATTIAWQIACRSRLLALGAAVAALVRAISDLCEREIDTVMPDFTYLHRAQPTTLAHYMLGHSAPFVRHLSRIETALISVDRSPAGSGSTNGSRLRIDRSLLAELLGFSSEIRHTRDAMWAPDTVIELMSVCMQVMVSVDRIAEELQIWTTEPFGFLELGDAQSRTSVVMPHKKNPYALSYLRGAARHLLGTVTGLTATLLTASGQPDSRTFAYGDVPRAISNAELAVNLLTEVLCDASFDRAAMGSAAQSGFTTSTEICDLLSLYGVENRVSHSLVGRAVRYAVADGRDRLQHLDLVQAAELAGVDLPLDQRAFEEATDTRASILNRVTPGGASPVEVAAMVAEHRDAAASSDRIWSTYPSLGFESRLIARARRVLDER